MFKHSGIVRRIDEAGRVSIPKEIRRKYRIQDGDPIEIGEGENLIMLKKYSLLELFNDTIQKLVNSFSKSMDIPLILCNTTNILYSSRISTVNTSAKLSQNLSDYLMGVNKNCISCQIEYGAETKVLAIEKIYINSYIEGALIIPNTGKAISDFHKNGLKLCAEAIAAIAR